MDRSRHTTDELTFSDNARVAVIGDSITHDGGYLNRVQAYYATCLPQKRVKLYNFGVSGNSAQGTLRYLENILAIQPTEAVLMFGVNDVIGLAYYRERPMDASLIERQEAAQNVHYAAMEELCRRLTEAGIPVTLCSAVGRDEITPVAEGTAPVTLTYGATERLYETYLHNRATLPGLKNTVDWLTPMQQLQAELAPHGVSLFKEDRTHPSPCGQAVMAALLLRAQGLSVPFPSAEAILRGDFPAPLSEAIRARWEVEHTLRDLFWIHPHQANRCPDAKSLEERVAFWREQAKTLPAGDWTRSMYEHYAARAAEEPALFADYLAKTDALY